MGTKVTFSPKKDPDENFLIIETFSETEARNLAVYQK